jgi:penicillin-binding protein 1C
VSARARLRPVAIALAAAAAFTACATVAWRDYRAFAGEPTAELGARWHEGVTIEDRSGRALRELPSTAGNRGKPTPLAEVGDRLVVATLVSEDKGFFSHEGVDGKAILRAVAQNARHLRVVSGASTITQQLVKLLDAGGETRARTLSVKVREAARAENLERVLGKEEILEAYLNRLSYGRGLVGPAAAADGYFGVAPASLSWAQAAYLAVVPRAPSALDPVTHPERVRMRQRALLDALRDEGFLSEADHARATREPVTPRAPSHPFEAPHFVEMLRAERRLEPGATTRTTLDLDLQRDAEGLVRTHLAAAAAHGAHDAAAIVVDNATGEVLAWIGSGDWDDPSIAGQVDLVRARRQPGSTLKPFVYALAFERGHTAAEVLPDVPTSFPEARGAWAPGNFDGTFEGPISAREALAGSLNVPAVRLAAELREGALLDLLHALGFASLDKDAAHYGLSLALGSGEVELRELGRAYVALARGGEEIPLRVTRSEAEAPLVRARVLDAGAAALVTDVLADPMARVRALHGAAAMDPGFPVAVKTGTSSGFRDAWTVGFSHERTVAVWVGNADGAPMQKLTGAGGAGPLFTDLMRRAMRDVRGRAPLVDEGELVTIDVCPLTGLPVGPACPEHAARKFARGHVPDAPCDVHAHARRRTPGGAGDPPFACDPHGDVTVALLPPVYDAWLDRQPLGAPGRDALGTPWLARDRVPGCGREGGAPALVVDAPSDGSVILASGGAPGAHALVLRASFDERDRLGPTRVGEVDFVMDGRVIATSRWPFRAVVEPALGDHELVVRPRDANVAAKLGVSRFSVR